jgi:hypothetical protein
LLKELLRTEIHIAVIRVWRSGEKLGKTIFYDSRELYYTTSALPVNDKQFFYRSGLSIYLGLGKTRRFVSNLHKKKQFLIYDTYT